MPTKPGWAKAGPRPSRDNTRFGSPSLYPSSAFRMTDVSLRSLTKTFGGPPAVDQVSLDIRDGEFVSLLGPSGCGKTTLLRAVAGLEPLSGGGIRMNDQAISGAGTHVPAENRRIGMVFQDFALFPHLSVEKNIDFGLTHWPAPKRQARVRDMLSLVGLTTSAKRYPHELSGGQQQRVAIARALAMEPELLLFDEPTSALDPELVGEVLRVIRALVEEGRTMLLVTHELGFAYHFANRILFIADGVIHEDGTPDEVLKHPRQARTQAFLARHNEFHF